MTDKNEQIQYDLEWARKIVEGDESACKEFVHQFNSWVLGKVEELVKGFCKYPAYEYICSLKVLRNSKKFNRSMDDRIQCDECIDSYIWMFNHLKTTLKAYKGLRGCRLSSYIFSLLNSRTMYVTWLRWKYGRIDHQEERFPRCIKELDAIEKKVFVFLRQRKSEEEISRVLKISPLKTEESITKVKEVLVSSGQIDLISTPVMIPLHFKTSDGEELEIPLPVSEDDPVHNILLKDFFLLLKESFAKLPEHSFRLLTLKYGNKMDAAEILDFCQKTGISLLPGKNKDMKKQAVYTAVNNAVTELLALLNEKTKDKEEFNLNEKGLKNILEDIKI